MNGSAGRQAGAQARPRLAVSAEAGVAEDRIVADRPSVDGGAPASRAPAPPPATSTPATSTPTPATSTLSAGTTLGERYLLRTRVGSDTAAGAEFWRAEDIMLRRDVGLTLLRRLVPETGASVGANDATSSERSAAMVAAAMRSGSFEHPGCARLLDVMTPDQAGMPDDVLGAAVTEWIVGRSIAESVADGRFKPAAAARAVQHLAAAAEEAHRHGFALGCDHPQRVRITADGRAALAFALPRPSVGPADDVRGLGALLFVLLTDRWPLSGADAARAGLAAAELDDAGEPVPPSTLRPGVPVELDALATGTLVSAAATRVRTASAVRRILDEMVVEADRVALFPPVPDGLPSTSDDVWQDRHTVGKDPVRRRKLTLALVALAVAVAVAVSYVAVQVGSLFGGSGDPPIVLTEPEEQAPQGAAAPPDTTDGSDPAVPSGAPVRVASVTVLDEVGDRDNSDTVSRVIDADPTTSWTTFTYRQQLPALKPGVGIVSSFASAVRLAEVTIDSPSPGTRVEIRSATSAEGSLADSVVIAEADLDGGRTSIPLSDSQPVEHVIVWITELGGGGGDYVTEIAEIEFERA